MAPVFHRSLYAICWSFLRVNPFLWITRHIVAGDTSSPVNIDIFWHTSLKYIEGSSSSNPTMINSSCSLNLLVLSLLHTVGVTSPVNWNRLKWLWTVPRERLRLLAISRNVSSMPILCHTTRHLKSLEYGAFLPGSADMSTQTSRLCSTNSNVQRGVRMRSTYVRTYVRTYIRHAVGRPHRVPRTVPWHAHARTQHAIRNPQCSNAAEINSTRMGFLYTTREPEIN